MITKAQVIDLYLASKRESEKLLALMKEKDFDTPNHQENMELIQIQIQMIDLFIEAINQDEPTQEELQHHFNRALSFGIDAN
jgi:hypothetical protein